MGPDYVQDGLTELPGLPAGGLVGTSGRKPATVSSEAASRSTVYDDYFPIGSAPTGDCPIHGSTGMLGLIGADSPTSTTGSSGVVPVSYATPGGHIEKVVAADGRTIWVVKQ